MSSRFATPPSLYSIGPLPRAARQRGNRSRSNSSAISPRFPSAARVSSSRLYLPSGPAAAFGPV